MLRYSCCRALVRGIFRALPRTTMLVASIPALPKLQPTPVLEAVNFMIRDVARAAAVLPLVLPSPCVGYPSTPRNPKLPSVPVVPTRSPFSTRRTYS